MAPQSRSKWRGKNSSRLVGTVENILSIDYLILLLVERDCWDWFRRCKVSTNRSRSTRKNRQVGNVGTYKTSLRLLLNFVDEQMAPPRRVPRASGSSYFLLRTTQNVYSIALNSFLVERRGRNKEESRKEWNDEWKSASNGPSPHAGNSSRFNKKTF